MEIGDSSYSIQADVIELIQYLRLARDLVIDKSVRRCCAKTWDAFESEAEAD